MRYLKFRWVLASGHASDHPEWGDSSWFYEFGQDGYANRQIILYDAGVRSRYHRGHCLDEYGEMHPDVPLDEINVEIGQEITAAEFEDLWKSGPWSNQITEPTTAPDPTHSIGSGGS